MRNLAPNPRGTNANQAANRNQGPNQLANQNQRPNQLANQNQGPNQTANPNIPVNAMLQDVGSNLLYRIIKCFRSHNPRQPLNCGQGLP